MIDLILGSRLINRKPITITFREVGVSPMRSTQIESNSMGSHKIMGLCFYSHNYDPKVDKWEIFRDIFLIQNLITIQPTGIMQGMVIGSKCLVIQKMKRKCAVIKVGHMLNRY
eukprot:NODE_587_length_5660_cov_0.522748.p7 type:complete len:113 gc:universal NODE_587_length_5660_cov_0.522748:4582-4244(-)